jgi:hypothetical protein
MRKYTPYEDFQLLCLHLHMPMKQIANLQNRAESVPRQRLHLLGLSVPKHIANKFAQLGRIQKGAVPFNKGRKMHTWMPPQSIKKSAAGRFKKGSLPHNTAHNNAISLRRDKCGKTYRYIRISQANWIPLHHHIWQLANGPIPKGGVLRFADGNSLNCALSNLVLFDRKQNMLLNSVQRFPDEVKQAIRAIAVLNRKLNQHEKQTIRP